MSATISLTDEELIALDFWIGAIRATDEWAEKDLFSIAMKIPLPNDRRRALMRAKANSSEAAQPRSSIEQSPISRTGGAE